MKKIFLFFVLSLLTIGTAAAASISITPSTQTVNPGDTFTIKVDVDPAGTATGGVQFNLNFNGALVNVNSVTEGSFLKQGGASTYFNAGTINNAAGTISDVYGVITTAGANVSTPGTFAIISLTAKANGVSPLNLGNVVVSDPNGAVIATKINNGSVTVGTPPLYVTISESPDPVVSGGTSQVIAHVTTTGGVAVSGASVSVSATGGSLSPVSGTTDASGDFKSTYTAPAVTVTTTYTISATAAKSGYTSGSGSDPITVTGPTTRASISITPSTQTVNVSDTFTIRVDVDPAGIATGGVQFNLNFNGALVNVNSVTEGNFLKQGGASTYFNAGTINNAAGTISDVYGVITTAGANVSTPGTFAIISLTAKANGVSPLNLGNVVVSDPNGAVIATTINNGSVTVRPPPIPPLYVTISESPDPVVSGSTSQVIAHVTTTGGAAVSGASVSVSATGGSLSPVSGTTDASGDFKSTYTAPTVNSTTTYMISAKAAKTGYTNGSGSDPITVNPKPTTRASISITPSTQTVNVSDTFTIRVDVDPAGIATGGVQFNLNFNGALVNVNSVTEGNFLKQGGASTYFNAGTINNAAGTISDVYGVITTAGANVSTPGTFAIISLTAKANGVSPLNLGNVVVSDPNGAVIVTTINNGSVTVKPIGAGPIIKVVPDYQEVVSNSSSTFDVDIAVDPKGAEVFAVEYKILFNATKLQVLSQVNGTFLIQDGSSSFIAANKFNNTIGLIEYGETRIDTTTGVKIPGVLTRIKFGVRSGAGFGNTTLNLAEYIILDPTASPIANVTEIDGIVNLTDNIPPVANCGPDKMRCENVKSPVQFNGSASSDPDGFITNYGWNFGDGTTGTGVSPKHTYTAYRWNGVAYLPFTVTLKVTDNKGATNTDTQLVVIWIEGDANGDGKVNIIDAALVGLKWNSIPADPCADLNNDGKVNIIDASIIGLNWGKNAVTTG